MRHLRDDGGAAVDDGGGRRWSGHLGEKFGDFDHKREELLMGTEELILIEGEVARETRTCRGLHAKTI